MIKRILRVRLTWGSLANDIALESVICLPSIIVICSTFDYYCILMIFNILNKHERVQRLAAEKREKNEEEIMTNNIFTFP
jgi:hypothetical protein